MTPTAATLLRDLRHQAESERRDRFAAALKPGGGAAPVPLPLSVARHPLPSVLGGGSLRSPSSVAGAGEAPPARLPVTVATAAGEHAERAERAGLHTITGRVVA